MIFGSFDRLHAGHRFLFKQAKELGDYLIAVAAQDHVIKQLKNYPPRFNISQRLEDLKKEDNINEVIIGDSDLSTWAVVKKYQPDIIALGYDQVDLKADLEKNLSSLEYQPEIKVLEAYQPEIYHSSLLC